MSNKRVFDKDLGVELVLDEDDELLNEARDSSDGEVPRSGRKRTKLDSNSSSQPLSSQKHLSPSSSLVIPIQSKQARISSVINTQPSRIEPNITSLNDQFKSNDDDSESENFEDIDYGEDDDDEYHTSQNQALGKDSKRSHNARHDLFHGEDDDNDDDENRRSFRNVDLEDEDDDQLEHEQGDNADEEQEGEDKANVERCKYWPSCTSGKSCAFYHPTKPCRAFPNCRFGQKCLYIHPSCKFGIHCAKPNCPFAHQALIPRTVGPSTARRPAQPSQFRGNQQPLAPKCRYGNNCANSMCKFSHQRSEPCRFGSNCLLESCAFIHPSDVTRMKPTSAFKWNAQS